MLKTIMNIILAICFIVMAFAIIVYYQTPTGRALVCISTLIAIISYGISEYLESKEEKES